MPKISVIVPVYNAGEYLKICLDSILAQTCRDLEILLIDDGSTDGSGSVCDEYAAVDGRVRVFHQKNRGPSAARNRGLDAAVGDYIAFADADDVLAPNMLELLLEDIREADMAVCNIQRISETGEPGAVCPIEDAVLTGRAFAEKLLLPQAWFYVTVPNRLYRRALFDGLRFPEGFLHEDEAIVCQLAARCSRVVTVSKPLYFYRKTAGSIMEQGLSPGTTDKLTALSRRLGLCRKLGWSALTEATALRFCHFFFDLYFRFPRDQGTENYFLRMEAALKEALPGILRAKGVSIRHKCYLTILGIHPKGGVMLRKWKKNLQKPEGF